MALVARSGTSGSGSVVSSIATSMVARVVGMVDCRGHFGARFPALSSMNQQLDLPHWRLTQRASSCLCLTDRVPQGGTPLDRDRKKRQRQYIAFAWVAAAVILLLAWLQNQRGSAQTIGLIIGLPIIAVLLIVAIRWGRAIKRP